MKQSVHRNLNKLVLMLLLGACFTIKASALTVSGNVYNDANALTDNTVGKVTGTTFNNATGLKAVLVSTTFNLVVATTNVTMSGGSGSYTFNSVVAGNYYVIITTNTATVGTAPPAVALPSGWVNVGENIGTSAGNDGTVDGKLSLGLITANVSNANFGIEKTPTATGVTGTSQQNPLGLATTAVTTLTGSDPEDQATSGSLSGDAIVITTLPSNGTLYYNGSAATAGQTISSYNPALLTVDPNDGISSLSFTYQYTDKAGQTSTAATVTMPFTTPVAFTCPARIFQLQGSSSTTVSLYNPNNATSTTLFNNGLFVNALAYNTIDNMLWAYDLDNYQLVRMDATGAYTSYTIDNMPQDQVYNGTFLPGGYYLMYIDHDTKYYVIDINPNHASTYLKLVDPANGYAAQTGPSYGKSISSVNPHDIACDPVTGLVYGLINPGSTNEFKMIKLDVTTNTLTIASSKVSGGNITNETGSFGTSAMDGSGNYYAYNDASGAYYRINVATNIAVKLSTGSSSGNTDGASCLNAYLSYTISGSVFNDVDGLNDNAVDGTGTVAGTTLYAMLYDNTTGKISDTVVVNSDGTYTLYATPGDDYKIEITANTATVGASALPAVSLPSGWLSTGEKFGTGTGSDGTVDGVLSIGVVSGNTSNANFGIEQQPTAGGGANSAVNQSGAVQITVPASTFTNTSASSDASPGAVTNIIITSFPTGAATIVINGTSYNSGNFPAAGVTVPTDASGNPTQTITADPAASGVTSVSIPFKAVDAAGATSTNTGTAVLNLTGLTVSGNIYDDANGLTDNTVNKNGTTLNNATGINAVLVNTATNTVAASTGVTMTSGGGTYSFSGVDAGSYYVMLTTNTATIGSAPPAVALPAGWVNTGENIGTAAGNDGTVDGKLTIGAISANTTNVNFGIEKTPTANAVTGSTQSNPGGTGTVTVPTLTGSDPEDQATSGTLSGDVIVITTLPSNGTLYYNGTAAIAGQVISGYNPTLLTVDPNDGISSLTFTYQYTDNAGQKSAAATVTMPFNSTISGTVFDDGDGLTDNQVDGTGGNAGGLNAILFDNTTGKVAAISAVAANGTYTVSGPPGDSYTIYISSGTATVGSTTVPTVAMPSGWFTVGENLGAGTGSDGTVNGVLAVGTLSANITNANFGIDKQPTGSAVTATSQPNPGGTTQAAVPSTVFNGTDNEDGAYTTGLAGRTVTLNAATGGTLYYNGTAVTSATTITSFDPTDVTVDPTGTGNTSVTFPYSVKDNAGIASANITATVPFTAAVINVSGTVWSDANADAVKSGAETFTDGGGLYANLVLVSTGKVIASVQVNASTGAYTFGTAASTQYKVILTNGGQTVGNSLAAATTPAGWVNTGVNLGGVANTGNKTGVVTLTTPASGTVANQNFGVLQCSSTSLSISASAGTPAPAGYVCKTSPSTVTLTSTPSGGAASYASYAWTGNGLTASNTQNTTANPTATGTFSVTVTDALGCTATGTTQTITYDDAKPSIFGSCVSGAVRLTDLNNVGVSWQWTTTSGGRFYATSDYSLNTDGDVSNLPGPYINIKGNYTLQVTDANGCVSTDTKLIQADPCGNTVLASNMATVTALRHGSSVQLQWQTVNESGIRNYIVERSTDGSIFTATGTIPSLNAGTYTYRFTDDVSLTGCIKLYYRVKQTNADGIVYYSNIVAVSCNAGDAAEYVLKVYPNPVQSNGWLTVSYTLPATVSRAQVLVIDVLGSIQYTTTVSNVINSLNTTAVPVNDMPAGTYFVRIVNEKWVSKTIKVIKGR